MTVLNLIIDSIMIFVWMVGVPVTPWLIGSVIAFTIMKIKGEKIT